MTIGEKTGQLLLAIRKEKPLVHHITNYVTVNDCANITLAVGASPIMADDKGEVEDITAISSVLVINMGTLNERTVASMVLAGKKANAIGIPVIFDPVGAGASPLRNETAKLLLETVRFAVVRGNASEIRYIAGLSAHTKGVDAAASDINSGFQEMADAAKGLAGRLASVVAVTGSIDIVTDGSRVCRIKNGHPMMEMVSGTGCMCDSVIASYCGVAKDYYTGAVAGLVSMGIAGQKAYRSAGLKGSGSYRVALIDEISLLQEETVNEWVDADEI